jgi:hypothetical protein
VGEIIYELEIYLKLIYLALIIKKGEKPNTKLLVNHDKNSEEEVEI